MYFHSPGILPWNFFLLDLRKGEDETKYQLSEVLKLLNQWLDCRGIQTETSRSRIIKKTLKGKNFIFLNIWIILSMHNNLAVCKCKNLPFRWGSHDIWIAPYFYGYYFRNAKISKTLTYLIIHITVNAGKKSTGGNLLVTVLKRLNKCLDKRFWNIALNMINCR